MKRPGCVAGLLLVALALAACASTGASRDPGDELLHTRCQSCHNLERISRASPRSLEGWEATIDRMRAHGAQITNDEAAVLAAYLTNAHRNE
ncbi:MAG: hypothetical protein KKA73_18170 [Chloroflexi bacterium]|nr:hypothetical protein [Chloroflexota bacterium]MBU1749614.1 hypothetical protein [Chloroflexota bacterium]